jgi:hypothetical protein
MPKTKQINESYSVTYNARETGSGNDIKTLTMMWENRDDKEIKDNLNTWLNAIGCDLKVVEKK